MNCVVAHMYVVCALLNNLPALLQVFTSALEPRNIVALIYIFWWWHDYYNYTIMRCYRNRSEKLLSSASAYSNYVKLQHWNSEFRSSTRYRNFFFKGILCFKKLIPKTPSTLWFLMTKAHFPTSFFEKWDLDLVIPNCVSWTFVFSVITSIKRPRRENEVNWEFSAKKCALLPSKLFCTPVGLMTKELVYQLHDFLSKKVGELLFRRLVIKMCKSARNFHLVGCKWRKPRFSAFFDVFPFMRPSDATHTQRWQRQTKKKWRVSQNIILLWPSSGEQSNSYLSGQALFLPKFSNSNFLGQSGQHY